MKNRDSGFTLMELVVVIGIIAILSAMSAPVMSRWKARHEFSGAVQDMMLALRQARAVAIKENKVVTVVVTPGAGTWQAFVDDGGSDTTDAVGPVASLPDGIPDLAQNGVFNTGERDVSSGTVPESVSIDSANFNSSTSVRFNNQGFPVDTSGTITSGTVTLSSSLGGSRSVRLYTSGYSAVQ